MAQQHALLAVLDFGQLHLTLYHCVVAHTQTANRHHPRAILVTQRQMKQQVLDTMDVQARQFLRHTRAHAFESVQGCLRLRGWGHGLALKHANEYLIVIA